MRAHLRLQRLPQRAVEGAEGLVQHEQARLRGEGAGEGHSLAFAAGELVDLALLEVLQPHQSQQGVHPRCHLVLRPALHPHPKADVARYVHVREEREVLEHEAEAAVAGRHSVELAPVEGDGALVRRLESRR